MISLRHLGEINLAIIGHDLVCDVEQELEAMLRNKFLSGSNIKTLFGG
jgi:hypothetical protein